MIHESFVWLQVSLEIPDKLFGSSFTTVTNISKIVGDLMTVISRAEFFSRNKFLSVAKMFHDESSSKALRRAFSKFEIFYHFLFVSASHCRAHHAGLLNFCGCSSRCSATLWRLRFQSLRQQKRASRATSRQNDKTVFLFICTRLKYFLWNKNLYKAWQP